MSGGSTLDSIQEIEAELSNLKVEYGKAKLFVAKNKQEKSIPLYLRRHEIVTGKSVLKTEELEGFEGTYSETVGGCAKGVEKCLGIPYFWLTVFRSHPTISTYVTKRDEGMLEHLEDVRISTPSDGIPGLRAQFIFSKTCPYLKEEKGDSFCLWKEIRVATSHSPLLGFQPGDLEEEASTIAWKEGMNLTVRKVEGGKKGGKGKKGAKTGDSGEGTKFKSCASFFTLFANSNLGSSLMADDVESPASDLAGAARERTRARAEKLATQHFEILTALKQDVVPHAGELFAECDAVYQGGGGGDRSGKEDEDEDDEFEMVSAAEQSVGSLPPAVQARVHACKTLEAKATQIRASVVEDAKSIVKEVDLKCGQLFSRRRTLLVPGGNDDDNDNENENADKNASTAVPRYWLLALKGGSNTVDVVRRVDEKPLSSLCDIRCQRLDDGFEIEFEFLPNDYFTNKVLKKSFRFEVEGKEQRLEFESEEDCLVGTTQTPVQWRDGRNTTQTLSQAGKIVSRPSFFWLFSPGGASHLFGLKSGEKVGAEVLKSREAALAFGLRDEVIPRSSSLYSLAARWDGGEVGSSSSEDEEEEGEGEELDGEATADVASLARKSAKKKKSMLRCGCTRFHGLLAIVVFIVLGELLVFLDSANFWRELHGTMRHSEL